MSPGGQSQELAALFVSFQTKGLAPLQAAQESILKAMQVLAERINAVGANIDKAMGEAGRKVQELASNTSKVAASFAAMAGGVGAGMSAAASMLGVAAAAASGFAMAGVAAGGMGQSLQFWMERVSLAVAGMFGPEIRQVINAIADFTTNLSALSDATKGNIAHLLELVAAFASFATGGVMGLLGGFAMLATASGNLKPFLNALMDVFKSIAEALAPVVDAVIGFVQIIMETMGPVIKEIVQSLAAALAPILQRIGPLLEVMANLFRALAPAIIWVVDKVAVMADMLVRVLVPAIDWVIAKLKQVSLGLLDLTGQKYKEMPKPDHDEARPDETKRVHGPEAIEAQWNRLAAAAVSVTGNMGGKPPQEEAVDWLKEIFTAILKQTGIIEKKPPAVGGV